MMEVRQGNGHFPSCSSILVKPSHSVVKELDPTITGKKQAAGDGLLNLGRELK
jgi:hypothetical protein